MIKKIFKCDCCGNKITSGNILELEYNNDVAEYDFGEYCGTKHININYHFCEECSNRVNKLLGF